MEAWHVVTLALVQGLTEFLPVSSSAHLILLPYFAHWPDQGLTFDVAVHVGTLGAVVCYFRESLRRMFRDWRASLKQRRPVGDSRLVWFVLFGTLPVAIAGAGLEWFVPGGLRSPLLIAAATAGFGLLLWWADAAGGQARDERNMNWRDALVIGGLQILALIPGASRSGVTIMAGRALGLSRPAAARFSFLLSIPVIALAGGLKLVQALEAGAQTPWGALLLGALVAFLSAYACIHFFLRLIERMSLLPFVIYRLALGAALFVLVV
ncbi:MAG: undecaprenyl-diphosphate phosphatase [Gammaproteobacteria bacterium]|nr:undecaprenyl-diphosphate phosphatase [Gammaproteobacteria bacterium]